MGRAEEFWRFNSRKHYVLEDLQRHTRQPVSETTARRLFASAEVLVKRQMMESYFARLRFTDGHEAILWAKPYWTRS